MLDVVKQSDTDFAASSPDHRPRMPLARPQNLKEDLSADVAARAQPNSNSFSVHVANYAVGNLSPRPKDDATEQGAALPRPAATLGDWKL